MDKKENGPDDSHPGRYVKNQRWNCFAGGSGLKGFAFLGVNVLPASGGGNVSMVSGGGNGFAGSGGGNSGSIVAGFD